MPERISFLFSTPSISKCIIHLLTVGQNVLLWLVLATIKLLHFLTCSDWTLNWVRQDLPKGTKIRFAYITNVRAIAYPNHLHLSCCPKACFIDPDANSYATQVERPQSAILRSTLRVLSLTTI